MYYNYHATAQKLIKSKDLIAFKISAKYNKISPALVLYFKSHPPMPIREHRWHEYFELLDNFYS